MNGWRSRLMARNERKIDARYVDRQGSEDKEHRDPEAPVIMRSLPIESVVGRREIWSCLRMVVMTVLVLTHSISVPGEYDAGRSLLGRGPICRCGFPELGKRIDDQSRRLDVLVSSNSRLIGVASSTPPQDGIRCSAPPRLSWLRHARTRQWIRRPATIHATVPLLQSSPSIRTT